MTVFQVYPGIELIYNNFEVPNFDFDSHATENIMEISHCRKGRVAVSYTHLDVYKRQAYTFT